MPRRRNFLSAGQRRGPRRETIWTSSADITITTPIAAGGISFLSSLNAAALALRPFTILRTRGIFSLISDQVSAAEAPFGAMGIAVVSDQASAAGLASLPSPIIEESSDLWFVYQFGAAEMSVLTSGMNQAQVYSFDSRAMRKVEDGEDIVVMVENASSLHGFNFIVKFRMLYKLH